MLMWKYIYHWNTEKNMICYKCSMEIILKKKDKAMKDYNKKLKKESYGTSKQTKRK